MKVSDLLWNLHNYYKQFVPSTEHHLQQRRQPLEKELKVCAHVLDMTQDAPRSADKPTWARCCLQDYVKIAKWNDANFWAMKQAAEKSHRTLHKFVHKFEVSRKIFLWTEGSVLSPISVQFTCDPLESFRAQCVLLCLFRFIWFILLQVIWITTLVQHCSNLRRTKSDISCLSFLLLQDLFERTRPEDSRRR